MANQASTRESPGQALPAGTVIRVARVAAGMTLAELGARCGYSASTVSRLERGKQSLRDIAVLASLAGVLGIPPEHLGLAARSVRHAHLPGPTPPGAGATTISRSLDHGGEAVDRRQLLTGIAGVAAGAALSPAQVHASPRSALTAGLEPLLGGLPVPATPSARPRLQAALRAAQRDFQAGRYQHLAATLPPLIHSVIATRGAATPTDRPELDATLAGAYVVASSLAVKVNDDVLGWPLADRATLAAAQAHDPVILAAARRQLAVVLRRTGHRRTAHHLLLTAAEAIEPAGRQPGAEQLAMYGTLLSTAAYNAAVDGDRSCAADLISEASTAARRLGRHINGHGAGFGPTNVILYRISIAQVLGDNGTAIQQARTIRAAQIPTAERRGRYWVDIARAYHQWGKPADCYRALQAAAAASPDDVRYRPPVHRIVRDLLRTDRRRTLTGLPAFAQRVGLPTT